MSHSDSKTTDCIVIGGGVIGMLTARELVQNGLAVSLFERGETGQEASWAGGGILSPLYPWRYPQAINTLAKPSQALHQSLAEQLLEQTGIDPEWTPSGCLIVNPADRSEALDWALGQGVELQALSDGEECALEPALETARGGALRMPRIAQIRNPRLLKALKASLSLYRVEICEQRPVQEIVIQGGRVKGVRTAQGTLKAGQVVLASGPWSPALLPSPVPGFEITPVRGQMILFRGPAGLLSHIVQEGSHYLIPRRDGRILAGSTVEYVGFDKSTTKAARDELQQAAVALVPALARFEIEHHWAGLRPGSPAGIPFIGPHPAIHGLYVNAGHFRNGLVLAPASARLLTELMLGRKPLVDPFPYSLNAKRT